MSAVPNRTDQTPGQSPDQNRGGSGPTDALRVVLIGSAPLDRALRRDPGIELLRARTPLLAIGELTQPIDEDSPARTVVVVGEECLPADHTAPFAAAVRQIDPSAQIFALASDPLADVPSSFTGTLSPSDGVDVFRAAVQRATQRDRAPRHAQQDQPIPPAPQQPAPDPSMPRHTELPDDAKLVRAILSGRPIERACLEQLRHRTRCATLEFVASAEQSDRPPGVHAAPVVHRGHTLGQLIETSASIAPQDLKIHALWLAHWFALAEQQRQLREAAFTDALTGAWNRRYFDRYLESCLQRAAENRQPVTVLLFDVDDFKKFNDCYGHALGDEILRSTVRLLKTCIRPEDRVCRIGGDEFAVVFYEPDGPREAGSSQPTSIFDIARRFQQRVQTEEFSQLGSASPGPLAISGGLATFPWDGRTPQELLAAADRLLIQSKDAGKNAIRYGSGVLCCDQKSQP